MPVGTYVVLVKKAKEGDTKAFGELYKFFLDRIYRFVYYLIGDEHLAEDIVQNTFLKAWKSLPSFSLDRGTFQSFLYTVARNLVIDNQRKKKKEVGMDFDIADSKHSEDSLVNNVWRKEVCKKVRRSLSVLNEFDKQMVILRFFEEMPYSEIAHIVGKKEGVIRVRVHRALRELKKSLDGKI